MDHFLRSRYERSRYPLQETMGSRIKGTEGIFWLGPQLPLTSRERFILNAIWSGQTMNQIAVQLGLSVNSVKAVREQLRRKYQAFKCGAARASRSRPGRSRCSQRPFFSADHSRIHQILTLSVCRCTVTLQPYVDTPSDPHGEDYACVLSSPMTCLLKMSFRSCT